MATKNVVDMTLTEFWKAQTAIRVRSKVLGEDVYFASRAHLARMLSKDFAVWLPKELQFSLGITDKSLIAINALKKRFQGFITKVVRPDEKKDT